MADDFTIRGADDLAALGRRLKGQERALRRDLTAGIRRAAKPATDAATRALAATAPGGALEERIRKQRSTVQVKTGARTAGVRAGAGKKGSGMGLLDRKGQVRHPVFGRSDSFVTQNVPGAQGAWSRGLETQRGQLQKAVVDAMEQTARRIVD